MFDIFLKVCVLLFLMLVYINYYFIYNTTKNKSYNYYIQRLIFYDMKYRNCNDNVNVLKCGSCYEERKNEHIDNDPKYYITNLSYSPIINTLSKNVVCSLSIIIIGITSAPNFDFQRLSFRLSYKKFNTYIKYYFFTGLSSNTSENEKLFLEQNYYNDIIIFNFESSYFNSSLLMISAMKWINRNCEKYMYFIYHSSDVYFNIKYFIQLYNTTTYNYIG